MFDFFFKLSDLFDSCTENINDFFRVIQLLLIRFVDVINFVRGVSINTFSSTPFSWILPFLLMFIVVRFAHGIVHPGGDN